MSNNFYGCTITKKGRALIAKLIAAKTLVITRVMVGSGTPTEDDAPGDLTDLVQPVAAATSTDPVYDGDTVHLTVEYRSDLNGGLDHGFWIQEFGVFANDPDEGEIMLYYGSLGDYPQYVSAYSEQGIDTRRYPISITVGEDATVLVDFSPEAFLTLSEVAQYCTTVALPQFLTAAQPLITAHNEDVTAHPAVQTQMSVFDARLSLLELMYNTDISGNPFTVTLDSLTDLRVSGVWNKPQLRLEF